MGAIDDARSKWDGTIGLDGASFDKVTDFLVDFAKASADSMASDTTAATKFWCNGFDFSLSVVSGKISPTSGTLTSNDTNYAQVSVQTDDAADSAPATALLWETKTSGSGGTGNWAVDVAKNNTSRTATNATLVSGANLHQAIAKQGSGVVVPSYTGVVRLKRIGG